ncbi:hypothetical protein [Azospirillum sp. TSO22-1]|uniref:hypothetical protein n=1 Tax=Azospirillum sp. TSO22-1 TaxID=716789 RepID=UPI000D618C3D|nr:hypothetical protein [Azospirillum sp. TSO22-1]PWC53276.1 hypothetical protein TSO221_11415 [Azospirillum sp. TSO22-1]
MSMWIAHFQDKVAHVVVDTVGSVQAGPTEFVPSNYTAKFAVVPHLNCVVTGRGDAHFSALVHQMLNRAPFFEFDDLTPNLNAVLVQAEWLHQKQASAGVAPPVTSKQEMLFVGYSKARKRPELWGAMWTAEETYRCVGPAYEGTWLGPDIPESKGRVWKQRFRNPDVDLLKLAQRQLAEGLEIDEKVNGAVGGAIIMATVTASGVQTKRLGYHTNHSDLVRRIKEGDVSQTFDRIREAVNFAAGGMQ